MTQAAKHTPAPWQLYGPHPSEQYVDQIDDGGDHRKSIFRIHHDDDISQTEAEANARLIAAAPDLLRALKSMLAVSFCEREIEQRAGAAIAKAENRGTSCL